MTCLYQHYFGLTEAPFSIAPAPHFLYMSSRHQEALAHLLYGLGGDGGFVLLTGEVGAGKTTICRALLEQIPDSCDLAYVFNPRLTVAELLSTICVEFGIACPPDTTSIKVFVDCINAHLLDAHARGRHAVLIIDEAQNLSADVLEQMRLLTNLETSERKLLQIILLGQPELAAMLERPELRQLAQRIVARYHLGPLNRQEVAAYVRHRLAVAGAQRPLIPASLMRRIFRLSAGVPRVINVLCDRALLGAYAQGKERVDRATLAQAAREVFNRPVAQRRGFLLAGLLVALLAALAFQHPWQEPPRRMVARASAPGLPNTLEWPASQPQAEKRGEASAYAALFQAWGGRYGLGDPCRQAEGLGLRCRTARAGLDELRQLNRPAVLRMHDDRGREFSAALLALSSKSATFDIAGLSRVVAASVLATQWSGYYTLFWRMPPATQNTIREGDHGPAVEWLREQFGLAQSVQDPVFDESLKHRVQQFQLGVGLVPDGNVGLQTLLRLLGAHEQNAPKLTQDRGER